MENIFFYSLDVICKNEFLHLEIIDLQLEIAFFVFKKAFDFKLRIKYI